MKYQIAIFTVLLLVGCASFEQLDRSRLNHPAMDLSSSNTPKSTKYLTNLGSVDQSGSGGGCTTCAH